MSYADKFKDPRWQKRRLEIFERDEFRCHICGSKDVELNVHHFFYWHDMDPWDYDLSTMITVCKECHDGPVLYSFSNQIATLSRTLIDISAYGYFVESLTKLILKKFHSTKELLCLAGDMIPEKAKRLSLSVLHNLISDITPGGNNGEE